MATVVVTGAAGFIGSHLTDSLLEKNYAVVGIDNLSMGSIENVAHHLGHPLFRLERLDVRDREGLRRACAGTEAIVHLAAFKIPRYGGALETLMVNSLGAHNVLRVASEIGCKVVVASTSDVYGKNPRLPFGESHDLVLGPSYVRRWAYAVSKVFEEHLCFAYHEAYALPFVILRFFGAYGPRHHLSWWGGPPALFMEAVLNDREIEIHGDGRQTRTFTYVTDTVQAIISALKKPEANGHIFNAGSTREISILQLARLIKKLCRTKGELKLRFVPYASFGNYEDVRRRTPDISKAERILGFNITVELEEGLLRTIQWHRERMAQRQALGPATVVQTNGIQARIEG